MMLDLRSSLLIFLLLGGNAASAGNDLRLVNEDLVYDSSSGLEWTRNANLVKTLCESRHLLWQRFDPTSIEHNSGRSAEEICRNNGRLNWYEARAWIEHLNTHAFLGSRNWRLPYADEHDDSCSYHADDDKTDTYLTFGHRCMQSELGHMFHLSLGNGSNPNCSRDCLNNPGPFENLHPGMYWSGTKSRNQPNLVGVFDMGSDWQDWAGKTSDLLYVWPVQDY